MPLAEPKRVRGSTPSHARSRKQEDALAARVGGKTTPRSGAGGWQKADVRVKGLARIEAKTTKHKSFSVTGEMIQKVEDAAMQAGELPVIVVELEGGARSVAVMPMWALDLILGANKGDEA